MTLTIQACPERLELHPGHVFALKRAIPGKALRVLSGRVWITETPAGKDHILREGEELALTGRFPYVFEALSEASLEVR